MADAAADGVGLASRAVVTWLERVVVGFAGPVLDAAASGPPKLVVYLATTLSRWACSSTTSTGPPGRDSIRDGPADARVPEPEPTRPTGRSARLMHEFLFSITYDEGVSRYADAFIDDGSLRSEAVYSCLEPTRLWRLEVLTGDAAALDAAEGFLLDESLDRETISERACEAERRHSLLTATGRRRVVYSHLDAIARCDAVPVIAARYVDGGSLIERTRRGAEARWRILMQDDEKAGMLYDTLGARLADGLSFRFERLAEVDGWQNSLLALHSLPGEQEEILSLAVERGYFETPRAVTLEELADQLDVPRSTASYRLRRAVAAVVTEYVRS